jgi:hypothetical protein
MTMKRANTNPDLRLDTYVERKNSSTKATWSFDVANGTYKIAFAAGAPDASGKQRVEVEDQLLVNNQTTAAGQFINISDYPVVVRDGQLDVRIGGAGGSTKTQLCFFEFTYDGAAPPPPPPSGNEAPPRPVTNVVVARALNDLQLSWTAVTEDTLGTLIAVPRYHVYRGTTPGFVPDRVNHTNRIGVVSGTNFTDLAAANAATDLYYLVTAGTHQRPGIAPRLEPGSAAPHRARAGTRHAADDVAGAAVHDELRQRVGPGNEHERRLGDEPGRRRGAHRPQHAGQAGVVGAGRLLERHQLRARSWRSHRSDGVRGAHLGPRRCRNRRTRLRVRVPHRGRQSELDLAAAERHVRRCAQPRAVAERRQRQHADHAHRLVEPNDRCDGKLSLLRGAWRGSNFAFQPGSGLAVLAGGDLPLWKPQVTQN